MQIKHVHSFSRGLFIGLEAFGAFVLFAALLWGALILRLSQGPMDVNYLTNSIEKEMNSQPAGFNFDVGNTVLMSKGRGSIEFEMRDVKVFRKDNTPILAVEKIGVKLSKKYLLIGRIIPRVVKIYGPALRVIKNEDGSFSLNVNDSTEKEELFKKVENSGYQEELVKGLLLQMRESDGVSGSFVSGLEKVVISDASMFYEDRKINIGWLSKKSNVYFLKKEGGITAEMLASVEMDNKTQGYIKGSAFYSWNTMKTNGTLYFTGINPSKFSRQSHKLSLQVDMNMDFKGSVAFECDENFKPIYSRFVLGAEKGTFNAMNMYNKPVDISGFYIQGKFDTHAKGMEIEKFTMSMGESDVSLVARTEKNDNGDLIVASAVLNNMPINNLSTYWPDNLAMDARKWVVSNLSSGVAKKATLKTILLADKTEFRNIELVDVKGDIDFEGIDVDYFHPLKKVENVSGKASYDNSSFNLDINTGVLDDVNVTSSKIKIYDLDKIDHATNANIDIKVSLQGPLGTVLKVIDSKPLQYPKKLGIVSDDFSGDADLNLSLNFPLYDDLKLDEVKVNVDAEVKNVLAKNIINEMGVKADSLKVNVNNHLITIDGEGILGEMPMTFKWYNSFDLKSAYIAGVDADIVLKEKEINALGLPESFNFKGSFPAKIEYNKKHDKTSLLRIKGDVSDTSFDMPYMSWEKGKGVSGSVDLTLSIEANNKISKVGNISYSSKSGDEADGEVVINTDASEISGINFKKLKLGKNDISVNLDKKEGSYRLFIKGKELDVSDVISSRKKSVEVDGDINAKPSIPMFADIAVDRLATTEKMHLMGAKIKFKTDEWERVAMMELSAQSGGKPLSMKYLPQVGGGFSFDLFAENAGEALEALDVTSSVKGGILEVKGYPNLASGPRNLTGTMRLSKFTLTNVSILGRLLNAMSLGGVVDLLNGKGIAFEKMASQFAWTEKGKPESKETVRLVTLKNGETAGASLGLTFSGLVDMKKKFVNIDGTIIPVSGISKVVGSIPLLGDILTGGDGGGIIAATYKIKGSSKDPEVTVNPLSVLAPGVIRKLFFE